ncbi:hypothetical protein CKO15_12105 [Halorhodospira abdelmalekii]|uniref:NfeD family protein n=1 Tax=Halorhodospira abdelmalekii TaxID=421629 RepID=UPI0019034A6E|nr:hypothetical protein [Halorhodospira abdelmalekii]MBK1736005.1 hypothetical protein [Halorhodospira abdelmalekii]
MGWLNNPEEAWAAWAAMAAILFVLELLLAGAASGVLLIFSVMALVGMVMALAGAPLLAQVIAAVVIGILSAPLMVWVYRRYGRGNSSLMSAGHGPAEMPWQAYYDARGNLRVRAQGEDFPAVLAAGGTAAGGAAPDGSSTPGREIAEGSTVQLLRIEGNRAVIAALPEATPETTEAPGKNKEPQTPRRPEDKQGADELQR